MKPVSILIVEDDVSVSTLLQEIVVAEGWYSHVVNDGFQALKATCDFNPDLVLLDLRLPNLDGFEVCQRVREKSTVPIIALSGLLDTNDKVRCLSLGADDYVTKPFAIEELLARMKTALRRNGRIEPFPALVITVGQIKMDVFKRQVFFNEKEIKLSNIEFDLLKELVLNQGITLTNKYLLSIIWGPEFIGVREYLYTHINQLRKKLEPDPKHPRYIICESKVGYRLQNTKLATNSILEGTGNSSFPYHPRNQISNKANHV